ncbi:hypothetical protein QL285_006509 [Trifolium repens]|nr:hypothetical protein QL285_006509 [Trifolium repens]
MRTAAERPPAAQSQKNKSQTSKGEPAEIQQSTKTACSELPSRTSPRTRHQPRYQRTEQAINSPYTPPVSKPTQKIDTESSQIYARTKARTTVLPNPPPPPPKQSYC